jgi:hypothetical protein
MLAVVYAKLNRDIEARRIFERFAASDFEGVPRNFIRLRTLTALAMVASHLGDATRSAVLRRLLAPYADQLYADTGLVLARIHRPAALVMRVDHADPG